MKFRIYILKIAFLSAAVLVVIISILSYRRITYLTDSSDWVNHTNLVRYRIEKILNDLSSAENDARGFLLTGDSAILHPGKDQALLESDLQGLDSLIKDNPMQQSNAASLRQLAFAKLGELHALLQSGPGNSVPRLDSSMLKSGISADAIKPLADSMISVENVLLQARTHTYRQQLWLAPAALLFLSLCSIGTLILAFLSLSRELRRSRQLELSEALLEKKVAVKTGELASANIMLEGQTEKIKEYNQELEERNKFAETLLNASADMIVVLDPALRIISVNRKAELAASELGKLIGRTAMEMYPEMMQNGIYADLLRAQAGESLTREVLPSRQGGKYYEVQYSPLPMGKDGLGVMIAVHDITRRVENEMQIEQLNQTFNYAEQTSKMGSFRYSFRSRLFMYSDNLFKLLGFEPNEFTPSAENFFRFVHPDDLEYVREETRLFMEAGLADYLDFRMIRKDGTVLWARNTGLVVQDKDEKVLIGTLQDITEQAARERLLQEQNRTLGKMNAELESFAYVSSHDLQEPLRKMLLISQHLLETEKDRLTEEGQSYFNRLVRAANRMQQLISDLLTYSRTNVSDQFFEQTDLGMIISQVTEELSDKIRQSTAVIEVGKLPEIRAIPFQMKQLFINLIGNSIKFVPPGVKPHVVISHSIADAPSDGSLATSKNIRHPFHKITVQDNGIGFDPIYKELIFEVFKRLHGRSEFEGTGIGLSIVKKIIENHQGMVNAEGFPGTGAIFTIYLPT